MTKNQKILLGVAIVAAAGWYLYSKNKTTATSAATTPTTPAATTPSATATPTASFVGVSKAQESKFANASGSQGLTLSKIGVGK